MKKEGLEKEKKNRGGNKSGRNRESSIVPRGGRARVRDGGVASPFGKEAEGDKKVGAPRGATTGVTEGKVSRAGQ